MNHPSPFSPPSPSSSAHTLYGRYACEGARDE